MYKLLIRPLFFLFDPESIHHFTFSLLRFTMRVPGGKWLYRAFYSYERPSLHRQLFGITFKNPVGLAAGFDKDALLINELPQLGFGFLEIGTLTPKPQSGNDRPRLFRLPADKAIINRMGFNNQGVLEAIEKLRTRTDRQIVIGGNIGKNKTTPNESAADDYTYCVEALYPYVDYFVVNVSSPNTPDLRSLQDKEPLKKLLTLVKNLCASHNTVRPVLLKIAPDLTREQLDDIIEILRETKTDGVIATNTTVSRHGLKTSTLEVESLGAGGLSGRPLAARSNEVIAYLRNALGKSYPIIGVGGILSVEDALEKIRNGADLVQLYTGFIYEGPGLVKAINRALVNEPDQRKNRLDPGVSVLADSFN
jgi:dihydroorotate dehydrogenase